VSEREFYVTKELVVHRVGLAADRAFLGKVLGLGKLGLGPERPHWQTGNSALAAPYGVDGEIETRTRDNVYSYSHHLTVG
jgi:hypothetical protein